MRGEHSIRYITKRSISVRFGKRVDEILRQVRLSRWKQRARFQKHSPTYQI